MASGQLRINDVAQFELTEPGATVNVSVNHNLSELEVRKDKLVLGDGNFSLNTNTPRNIHVELKKWNMSAAEGETTADFTVTTTGRTVDFGIEGLETGDRYIVKRDGAKISELVAQPAQKRISFQNSQWSQRDFTVVNDGDEGVDTVPSVTLNEPGNGVTFTGSQTIEFNATVTDDKDLVNATLYGNFSGDWEPFNTEQYSGNQKTSKEAIFNREISAGTYKYNFKAWDNNSQSSFASSNRTFTVESQDSGGGGNEDEDSDSGDEDSGGDDSGGGSSGGGFSGGFGGTEPEEEGEQQNQSQEDDQEEQSDEKSDQDQIGENEDDNTVGGQEGDQDGQTETPQDPSGQQSGETYGGQTVILIGALLLSVIIVASAAVIARYDLIEKLKSGGGADSEEEMVQKRIQELKQAAQKTVETENQVKEAYRNGELTWAEYQEKMTEIKQEKQQIRQKVERLEDRL